MFNLLDDARLNVTLEGEDNGTGVLASAHEKGVTLLLWNLPEVKDGLPVTKNKVTINLENLPFGTYRLVRHLVDSQHMPGQMQMVEHKRLIIDNVPDDQVFDTIYHTRLPLTLSLETYGLTLLQLNLEIEHSANLDLGFRDRQN
jgi:hypothetical protein